MEEVWKSVVGYEGYYEVSNLGRVRRVTNKNNLLVPNTLPYGYLQVCLSVNAVRKQHRIHRLVAEAFLPNPNNLPIVNHKDWNPSNNRVDNLEWCDVKYNNSYRRVSLSKIQGGTT